MTESKELATRNNSPIEMLIAAKEAGVAPADLQGFLDVQINHEKRQAEKEYNSAMSIVHSKVASVSKTAFNQQTRSNYAELDKIIKSVKPIYTDEGFSVLFYEGEGARDGCMRLCADVLHRLGHKQTFHYDIPLDGVGIKGNANMTAIHAKASSTSYGRRYLMCMIFNIPTGDDNDAQIVSHETISDEQIATLSEWIQSTQADEKKFCEVFRVENIGQLKAGDYQNALKMLKLKAEQAKKKAVKK